MSPFGAGKMGPPRPPAGGTPSGPPKMKPPAMPEAEPNPDEGSGKVSREEALVITADKHCGDCEHFQQDGSCMKVDGQFDPEDSCLRHFEPKGQEQDEEAGEPAESDNAGAPDMSGDVE